MNSTLFLLAALFTAYPQVRWLMGRPGIWTEQGDLEMVLDPLPVWERADYLAGRAGPPPTATGRCPLDAGRTRPPQRPFREKRRRLSKKLACAFGPQRGRKIFYHKTARLGQTLFQPSPASRRSTPANAP